MHTIIAKQSSAISTTFYKQLRMLMETKYVADGLRAPLMNVEVFAEAFQQILMEEM